MSLIPIVVDKEGNNERSYDIFSRLLKDRIIFLSGEINDDTANSVVAELLYLDSIEKKDIQLYINSPGGKITSGMAIYDTMNYINSDVSTICVGLAASMAAFLLLSGTKGKRYITPNSEVMIHEVSTFNGGKIGDVKISYEHSNALNERIIKILADNTGKDIDQIRQDIQQKDKWFNSDEALDYGLVDKLLTKTA